MADTTTNEINIWIFFFIHSLQTAYSLPSDADIA